jgi:hypothetical protein
MRTIAHPRDYRRFGRRQPAAAAMPATAGSTIGDDVRLFLWTFVSGFLAVSIYLA